MIIHHRLHRLHKLGKPNLCNLAYAAGDKNLRNL